MDETKGKIYKFGEFTLDAADLRLMRGGETLSLTQKALKTLLFLVENHSRVVTRDELLEAVWQNSFVEENVLSVNISNLRKAFGENKESTYIRTISRRGYQFVAPVETLASGTTIIKSDAETISSPEIDLEIAEKDADVLYFERRRRTEITFEKDAARNPLTLPAAKLSSKNRTIIYSVAALGLIILIFGGWFYFNRETGNKIDSMAVLPLKSIAPNDADKALGLGLADSLISRLGGLRKMTVRPLTAVNKYLENEVQPLDFAKDLQVDAVLEGTFQRAGNRLRVNVRLLRVADGVQIWAGTFDETETDIFKLQDSLSAQVAKSLRWNLTKDEREILVKRPTENVEAYEKYLRGRYLWNQRTSKNLLKAIEEFENAVRLDPNFAPAYVGAADCYALLSVYDERPPLESYPIAKQKAQTALNLDPNSSEAHTTLAFISYRFEWNWQTAENEFRRAIELNPNYSTAHHWFGELLTASGRFDEAVAEYRKSLEIDPTSLIINTDLGYCLFLARRYDESIAQLQKTVNLNPNFPLAYYCLADSLDAAKRERESIEIFIKWLSLIETDRTEISKMQTAYNGGKLNEFKKTRLKWIESEVRKKNFTQVDLARYYAEAGDANNALGWLENALRTHAADLIFIAAHPNFDSLRNEPRFQEILRQINLAK